MAKDRSKNIATPKKRYLFFDTIDANYQEGLVRSFFGEIQNFTITLHRVDIVKSKVHRLYGEAKAHNKKLLEPIELTIVPTIGDSETNFIGSGGLYDERISEFSFAAFIEELEDKGAKINKGDFVSYNDGDVLRYFEITKSSNVKSNNTIAGTRPYYINVKCIHVKADALPRMDG